MGRIGLSLLIVVLLLGGCRKSETPASRTVRKPVETAASGATVDDFGLPLIIHMDVPEAPQEVQKPSPPLPKEPEQH